VEGLAASFTATGPAGFEVGEWRRAMAEWFRYCPFYQADGRAPAADSPSPEQMTINGESVWGGPWSGYASDSAAALEQGAKLELEPEGSERAARARKAVGRSTAAALQFFGWNAGRSLLAEYVADGLLQYGSSRPTLWNPRS
jgi:hypothetical protein